MEISLGKLDAADRIIFRPRDVSTQRSVFCVFLWIYDILQRG